MALPEKKRRRIAVTIGDLNGIGPEVVLKLLAASSLRDLADLIIISPRKVLQYWNQVLNIVPATGLQEWVENEDNAGRVRLIEPDDVGEIAFEPGRPTEASGRIAGQAIIKAVELVSSKRVDAIVTAPISKQALHRAGFDYPGHTEFLAELAGIKTPPVMMLAAGEFRVALATTHIAVREVAAALSQERIITVLTTLDRELRERFGLHSRDPEIAVAALNPHAGESGAFGDEEQRIIAPALEVLRHRGLKVSGPYAADALFSRIKQGRMFDAYLAMYHDQGLIPLKIFGQGRAVNYTCGLPFIRTSPDHGTAYDIVGHGSAGPESLIEAVHFALRRIEDREQGNRV